jgi:hypothetical protein
MESYNEVKRIPASFKCLVLYQAKLSLQFSAMLNNLRVASWEPRLELRAPGGGK